MAAEVKFGFSLTRISTEQFATFEENLKENVEVKQSITVGIGHDFKNKQIGIFTKASFEQDSPFLVIEAGCHYRIKDETWENLKTDAGTYIVSKKNIQQLVLLSLVTMRGILHAKTENTPLNKYFIISFNISDLIKEDYIIEVDTEP